MKLAIIGAGNMATGFATLAPADSAVKLYTIEKSVYDEINKFHSNSKYASVRLTNNVSASMNLAECLKDSEIVVFSVPSAALRDVCEKAKSLILKKAIIIILSKGLDENGRTMSEVIKEYFSNEIVVVGGPSIANELMNKSLTFVVFASNGLAASKCKKLFENDYYNIAVSKDVLGVELCSFLKNVYAIYLGIANGLGYGMNTKAALISKCLEEMSFVCETLGAQKDSAYSLAGVGDLITTSLSDDGRNKRFGELVAKGNNAEDAKKIIGQVVEGDNALKILRKI
ncbi:MAG: NAD(P)H-dependent glycerol-3-phosphate dehydrogenase, partial [Candidatus Nanoarchaeia archaeon]